jgi:hypothetical protein
MVHAARLIAVVKKTAEARKCQSCRFRHHLATDAGCFATLEQLVQLLAHLRDDRIVAVPLGDERSVVITQGLKDLVAFKLVSDSASLVPAFQVGSADGHAGFARVS